jgi:hypothetical protein
MEGVCQKKSTPSGNGLIEIFDIFSGICCSELDIIMCSEYIFDKRSNNTDLNIFVGNDM